MKRWKHILLLWTALLLALGCRQEPSLQPEGEQTGSLLLNFGSAAPTKAAADADGANFHNILVLIANDADKLIDKKFHEHGDNYLQADTIFFWNLRVGEYHVYAYANIDHVDWQSAQTIQDVENSLNAVRVSGGDAVNPDRQLKELSGTDTPGVPATHMLLTGHKLMSVGSNENIGEVALHRPVSRLNVFLHNHTQFKIRLDELSFSSFNPSHSYLLGHLSAEGVPQLPPDNVYRDLPPFGAPQELEAGTDAKVYSTLLYENAFPGEYRMFSRITLDPGGEKELGRNLSDGVPVQLLRAADVFSMYVGETKDVLLLNPNTSNGGFFGRNGSSGVKTDARFSTEGLYADKAREIYADEAKRNQYVFVLRREADDADGNRLYTLTIDGFNWFAANGGNKKPGAFIEEGALPSGSDPISADFEGSLLRFRTDAWGNLDYFRNSGNANPYYFDQKSTHDYEERGIYQWAFYEVNVGGSPMRVIDNQTAQVSALRYMRRNQELNVVMNAYYEENERVLEFSVDNATWTQAHASSHVFK